MVHIKATDGGNLRVSVDQVDSTTNSLKTLDYSHAELHSGNHYNSRQYFTLAKNATRDLLIITPDTTRWAHALFELYTTAAPVTITIYEDTITSADGTLAPTVNRNRNFPDDNTTIVYDNPTVTTPGTMISDSYFGAGKFDSGTVRSTNELLLKQNTKYLVRMVEQNVAITVINLVIDWYEHTNVPPT